MTGALVFHRDYGVGRLVQIGDGWQTSAGDVSVAFVGFGHRVTPPCLPILAHHTKLYPVPADLGMYWVLSGKLRPSGQLLAPDPNLLEMLRSREIARPHGRKKDLASGPCISDTAIIKPVPYPDKGAGFDWLYFMRPPHVHHHTTRGRSKEERYIDRRGVPFVSSLDTPIDADWEHVSPYRKIIYPPAVFKRDLRRREREQVAQNRRCGICGKPFEAKRSDAHFCSVKCRKANSRKGKSQIM
jgi:hypothetical protein